MLWGGRFTTNGVILHAASGVDDALIVEFRTGDLSSRLLLWHHGTFLALSTRSGEQRLLDDHQIGQSKQGMELCGVLVAAAIAQLLMAEAVLDKVEGVLDHGRSCESARSTGSASSRKAFGRSLMMLRRIAMFHSLPR